MKHGCEVRVAALPEGADAKWLGTRKSEDSEWALTQCHILSQRPNMTEELMVSMEAAGDIVTMDEAAWRTAATTDKYHTPVSEPS